MHTAPARRAAEARLKSFRTLWTKLAAELAGDDLENGIGPQATS